MSLKSATQSLGVLLLLLFGAALSLATHAQQTRESLVQFTQIEPGIEYAHLTRTIAVNEEGSGPWSIHLLKIDPRKTQLQIVRAMDQAVGVETVSSLAARHGAIAAINGGYFRTSGVFRGESTGTFLIAGKLVSEPHHDRASLGLLDDGNGFELLMGRLKFAAQLSARNLNYQVNGFNRPPAADELVIFTPEFHRTTLTTPGGIEVVTRRGKVISVNDHTGSNPIPQDGLVISATGRAREWVLQNLRKGSSVKLSWKLIPLETDQQTKWSRASNIVGAGPQLISGGKVLTPKEHERFLPSFVNERHPRTAIARLGSGEILMLTVDGRQPRISVGLSLPGLTQLLLEFGATDAINLDGGGSTTMVVRNKVMNSPSDQTGERPVSDAILVFPRQHK